MTAIEELLSHHPDDLPREVSMSSDRGAWRARMHLTRMIREDDGPARRELAA